MSPKTIPKTIKNNQDPIIRRPKIVRGHPFSYAFIVPLTVLLVALPLLTLDDAFLPAVEEKTGYEPPPVKVVQITSVIMLVMLLVPTTLWWIEALGTKLTVTNERTILRRGIFARHLVEVRHRDVRTVQVNQSILERICGVGRVSIGTAGHAGMEIEVNGLLKPTEIRDKIYALQRSAEDSL